MDDFDTKPMIGWWESQERMIANLYLIVVSILNPTICG